MSCNARRRHITGAGLFFGRPRWRGGAGAFALLSVVGGCVLSAAAGAQSQECEGLADDNKALCQLMVACAAIDDADRREECFRVAANTVRDTPIGSRRETAPAADTPTPNVTEEESPPRMRETVPARPAPPAVDTTERASAAPAEGTKPRWRERIASVLRRDDSGPVVAKQVQRTSFEIPKRFSAIVTSVHRSGRNRGLVVLDGTLLFESDRAGEGNLRVGDEVRVVRASRLYGKRFQITGPSRRPFVADRVRCERDDITPATRRQCRLVDD